MRTPLSLAALPQSHHARIPDNTLAAFAAIESGDAEQMVDSTSEALLEEIRHKHKSVRSWPWAAGVFCGATMWAIQNGLPSWVEGLSLFFGIAITTLAYRWDVQRKLAILHYDLDSRAIEAYGKLVDASARIAECAQIWHVRGQAAVLDRKYHSGASTSVSRAAASVGTKLPPFFASNVDPVCITLSRLKLFCFPDRILVYQGNHVGSITYGDLECAVGTMKFVELGAPPKDAEVVSHTWRVVNKEGGPDKRFKDNRKLPICLYGELTLKSSSGLNEVLQTSRAAVSKELVAAFTSLKSLA
jgi:hypothetical protein